MNNWPKLNYSFFKRTRLKYSLKILQWLKQKEDICFNPLKKLHRFAKWNLSTKIFGNINCPRDIKIKLLQLIYSEIYFIEDIDKLKNGISELFKYKLDKTPFFNEGGLQSWFENAGTSPFGSNAASLGKFDLKKINPDIKYFKDLSITLKQISPSIFSLSFVLKPSKYFIDKYQKIIKNSEIYPYTYEITLSGEIKYVNPNSPVFSRNRRLDELFLMANKEIVQLLRKYFDCGLAVSGPLPFIEVLTINQPIDILTNNKYYGNDIKKNMRNSDFFRSIGFENSDSFLYSNNYLKISKSNREQYYLFEGYQVLVSELDFINNKRNIEMYDNNIDIAISQHLYYYTSNITTLLAIKRFVKNLEQQTINLRNELSSSLRLQSFGKIKIRSIKYAINKLIILNGFQFHHKRINSEINDKYIKSFLLGENKGLLRKYASIDDSEEFIDDLWFQIESTSQNNQARIKLLEKSFNKLRFYKFLKINHKTQISLKWLTWLLLITTILLLLPIEVRTEIYYWIINKFSQMRTF